MHKTVKYLIGIITVVAISVCSLSCMNTIKIDRDSEESSQNAPITSEKQFNFEIKITNSLDIVSDGIEVLDEIRPSVVEIYSVLTGGQSSGSGVVLSTSDTDENGSDDSAVIVTCHHVIEGAYEIVVKAIDGSEYYAELIGSDPESDIALLMIEDGSENPFKNITSALV